MSNKTVCTLRHVAFCHLFTNGSALSEGAISEAIVTLSLAYFKSHLRSCLCSGVFSYFFIWQSAQKELFFIHRLTGGGALFLQWQEILGNIETRRASDSPPALIYMTHLSNYSNVIGKWAAFLAVPLIYSVSPKNSASSGILIWI